MTAVVFDLDGTLVDSAGDLQGAANHMLAALDRPPLDRETVIGFIGRGVETLVRRVLAHSGVAETEFEASFERFHLRYAETLTRTTRLYPGVEALLDGLRSSGFELGVCTNKPEAPARAMCQALGMAPQFATIVGGDTLPVKKPDPRPLLHAIEALGATVADTIYVGDSDTDYLTARAAGVRFIYFEGGYQRAPIPDFQPDYRIADMAEVTGIVRAAAG